MPDLMRPSRLDDQATELAVDWNKGTSSKRLGWRRIDMFVVWWNVFLRTKHTLHLDSQSDDAYPGPPKHV